MVRRSITVWPALESLVREFQADLLKFTNRDITFTDALNLLLLGGVTEKSPDKFKGYGREWLIKVLDNPDRHVEGILDDLHTSMAVAPAKEPRVPKQIRRP